MYDPSVLLDGVDDHVVPFLALSAVSFGGLFVWYREALVAGARDRCASMPPVITMAWLVHDATVVGQAGHWFGGRHDHWLMQLYWVAMVGTALVEVLFVRQLLRYGREELAPTSTPAQFRAGVLVALAATAVIWWVLKRTLADDLFQVTFGLTAAMFPPCGMAMVARRGDRRGQTVPMWAGFTTAVAGWWLASYVAFGPWFRSAAWVALGIATVGLGAAATVVVGRTPEATEGPIPVAVGGGRRR